MAVVRVLSRRVDVGVKPALSRAEALDRVTRERISLELAAALKRRTPHEAKVAAALRTLAPHSAQLGELCLETLGVLTKRKSFERELFQVCLSFAAESAPSAAVPAILAALSEAEPRLSVLAAASVVSDSGALKEVLQRLSSVGVPSLAFACETARTCRGEAGGDRLAALATRLKESARASYIEQILFPLSFAERLPYALSAALRVLRSAERDLGRFILIAKVGMLATDGAALAEATLRSATGVLSSRPAWRLVAWSLGAGSLKNSVPSPKLSAELSARLSDRPSSENDDAFLFALAEAGEPAAMPLLLAACAPTALPATTTTPDPDEAPTSPSGAGVSRIRAQRALAMRFAQAQPSSAHAVLLTEAKQGKEEIRGLALASAWDAAVDPEQRALVREVAGEAALSRNLATTTWASLVRLSHDSGLPVPLVTERRVRWLTRNDLR
jgi:hypothetical protein